MCFLVLKKKECPRLVIAAIILKPMKVLNYLYDCMHLGQFHAPDWLYKLDRERVVVVRLLLAISTFIPVNIKI